MYTTLDQGLQTHNVYCLDFNYLLEKIITLDIPLKRLKSLDWCTKNGLLLQNQGMRGMMTSYQKYPKYPAIFFTDLLVLF